MVSHCIVVVGVLNSTFVGTRYLQVMARTIVIDVEMDHKVDQVVRHIRTQHAVAAFEPPGLSLSV
jgi:hypothetical protein